MQDVHPSLLGDRRPIHHHHPQEALKCPRCDSLDTKFCYYNNYNLSQPRHFCKNCRRYWTNGGVLRNVPVGGGSRKSKRSNPKSKPKPKPKPKPRFFDNNQNPQIEEIPLPSEIGGLVGNLDWTPGSDALGSNGSSAAETTTFGEFLRTEGQLDEKMQGLAGAVVDQTVRIDDVLQNTGRNDGFVALDWESNDQNGMGLFNHDDQGYWSQATTTSCHHLLQQQWCDTIDNNISSNDNLSFFLP